MTPPATRRALLAAIGSIATAGCLGRGTDGDAAGGEATDAPQSIDAHPAADGVADAPTLGPDPGAAEATIVAFEDPSCSTCAAFADETLPRLCEAAIDPGRVSYVWRSVPGVEPWGRPATRALWAVYREDPDGFWALKERYYERRAEIDADSVRQRTREFLEAGVSTAAADDVLAAVDGDVDAIEERIERDERAAEESDVGVVPSFALFRGGEHVTTVSGNQSYGVFEGALEL
ncbi:DsbA family protein [Halomicrobium salinisoli]|uniref:DsbA family protein n=1 Tax=Halomicrobium salinisoli TaxID=2878391 RepID=UPI001CF08E11|nr:thioredoxin domain-containing protein [Halomicrobium salinisoli]